MKFAAPYLLNLLWALIPIFGIMVYGIRKRKKILHRFAGPDMLALIVPGFDPKRRWIKTSLIILASGFAIVALAGPQLGYRWEKTTQKGVDIMIALDCSKSMLAQDIKPNRLERAKREIIDLMRMMKSDRAGLVAFSGNAILQCPLTLDHEAFNIFLKVLDPGFLPTGGTNLHAAIMTSYNGFEKETDTQKAIIIITDGENTQGTVEEAAKEMAKQGIKIFAIGVGDLQGAPIPDENGGFKKDASGNIILSKVDEQGLEKLAALTGGTYVRSVAGDMDLDLIYTDKIRGTMESKTLTSGKKKVWENRYQWFLFPGLILLLIEFVLSSKKKSHGLVVFVFAFCISFFIAQNNPVQAKMVSSSVKQGIQAYDAGQYEQAKKHFIDAQLANPDNAKIYYDIGAAAYMNKEYEQAQKNFTEAAKSTDAKLRHDARYNLANTQYRMGNLDEAVKGYENILAAFPEDKQAKENLEFVKQKKQEKEQQSKSDKDNQEKKEDQNKDDQKKKDGRNPDQNQDNKDQNKDSQKDKDQAKDPNQQQSQPGSKENQQPDQKENTPPQPREDEPQPAKGKDASPPEDQQALQAGKNMENMLNRLEDKPGRAMMPVLQKQYIEKDW
ncbi:MAG: VWA domain-containing protein [Proteobacteria bacterium]|nr:VWA domain-containing protein [Pseudomonadota bacterium]MBU1585994.1 VWA domain-containing protein [Pseudomonadota bacterium]MBU2452650.1 VWA domain-containing protein [Pseudomonadota bacterium]MBU2630093.1 VWA domain-containing protein [Pseudomonadota bacterium]